MHEVQQHREFSMLSEYWKRICIHQHGSCSWDALGLSNTTISNTRPNRFIIGYSKVKVKVLEWSSQSPDLNCIKPLWGDLKCVIGHQRTRALFVKHEQLFHLRTLSPLSTTITKYPVFRTKGMQTCEQKFSQFSHFSKSVFEANRVFLLCPWLVR